MAPSSTQLDPDKTYTEITQVLERLAVHFVVARRAGVWPVRRGEDR